MKAADAMGDGWHPSAIRRHRGRDRNFLFLKGLGVNIALDDFGTGYSPLTYLKELPIVEVELDRSFVAELGTDERAGRLLRR